MDTQTLLQNLAIIVVLGVSAQWIAWRLRLPSILMLLLVGFLAGPVSGLLGQKILDPETVLGDLILPIVSISVALILFEGGLSLRIKDLPDIGHTVRNLCTIGALATLAVGTIAARFILGMSWDLALLLGAILIVTGPTVIVPLLRHVRPTGRVGSILRWEGIVIDPVGATIAVLVFEAILHAEGVSLSSKHALFGFVTTTLIGGGVGIAGAAIIYILLKKYLIPEFLENAVTLMMVVAIYTISNMLMDESGLFAVTIMGIGLANQPHVAVKHIVEFKENLQVLLISGLFIVLAANLELAPILRYLEDWKTLVFLATMILVGRPICVALCTIHSGLNWRERAFLALMAPRGIVAAAVASIFALRLVDSGRAEAEALVPYTFLVIIATVTFYGLGSPLIARWLGVSQPNPQGVLFIGAHPWARAIAAAIQNEGCDVLIADTNRGYLQEARMGGLKTYFGNALSEHALEEMELDGIGRMMALTSNDEVNSLASLHFAESFGRAGVFQLIPENTQNERSSVPKHLRGRYVFGENITFSYLEIRWATGAEVKATKLSEAFDFASLTEHYGDAIVPLFVIGENGELTIITPTDFKAPRAGQTVISLVDQVEETGETEANAALETEPS